MILIDYSQISIAAFYAQPGAQLSEEFLRHLILNTIRMYSLKHKNEYGQIVLACDGGNSWRKGEFAPYKAHRKKARESSGMDWNLFFEYLNNIREEIKANFPYKVIHIHHVEADDVIGTLCKQFGSEGPLAIGEKILILSGDKDFNQLQKYSNVQQYDPVRKKFIKADDPYKYLQEHIIKGDSGDGIPNFLSDDNCLVVGTRQKPVTQKKLDSYLNKNPEEFCQSLTELRNYKRNQQLIDLSMIPHTVSESIMEEYNKQANKKAPELMNYFIQYKLKNLMEHINEYV